MRTKLLLIAIVIATHLLQIHASDDNNIIVDQIHDYYTLIPDKSGKKLESIKQRKLYKFHATQHEATAYAYVDYNDYKTVDNAKAKGSKPFYGNATSAGIFHDDSRMCILPINLDKPDKCIDATFECTFKRPELGQNLFIGANYPVKQYVLTLSMPAAMQHTYDIAASNLPDSTEITRGLSSDGKRWEITLTANNVPTLTLPDDAPPVRVIRPYVRFTGMFANLSDFYTRLHEYTLRPDPNHAAVSDMARRITANCTTTTERIAEISKWVNSNIRYIAIEHGELGWEPELPSVVLEKLYGDCKGSANLIKAMLKSLDIDSRLVWIGTKSIPDELTDFPMYSTFNHMIAAAILPGDSILYIDGTVGINDLGYYPDAIQGKQTLIEDGDRYIVHRVPELSPEHNSDETIMNYTLTGSKLEGDYKKSVTGAYKSRLLNTLQSADRQDHKKILLAFVNEGRKSWNFDNLNISNTLPDNGASIITANVKCNAGVQQSGGNTYLSFDLVPLLSKHKFELKDRTVPGYISTTQRIKRTLNLTIPQGVALRELPKDLCINNNWLNASLSYSMNNSTICVNLTIDFTHGIIPLEHLEAFSSDINKLSRAINNKIVLINQPLS